VRKVGVPWQPELAMGAVASGGARMLDYGMIRELGLADSTVDEAVAREEEEVARREELFRGHQGTHSLQGKIVILADDGAATGASMLAGIRAARTLGAREVVVAVPVASPFANQAFEAEGCRCYCVMAPRSLQAVGQWYERFEQLPDEEVNEILRQARG
jgi:putative phosphoribosyl transferase